MRLMFLHGPPAVGKLTVARELSRLTGLPVFHNHLVVDALTAVFSFGSPPFVRLREEFWLAVFRGAAETGQSLIFTFAPERTVTPGFVPEAVRQVQAAGGSVTFVRLAADRAVLEQRVDAADRAKHGKLTSLVLLKELEQSGVFDYPALPDSGITVDTGRLTPVQAAERIAAALA